MDMQQPTMASLFAQLGLPDDAAAIGDFITRHRPLSERLRIDQAPFWTTAQAGFLREAILDDADWAAIIDTLDAELRICEPHSRSAL